MAIAFGSIGAKAAGQGSVAVPHPASVGAGDLLVSAFCSWLSADDAMGPVSGWTAAGQLFGGTGVASDGHTTSIQGFARTAAGGETGTVTFTQGGALDVGVDGAIGVMLRYTKTADTWDVAAQAGAQATHQANRVVTFTALNVDIGDRVVALVAVERDNILGVTGSSFAGTATTGTPTMRTDGTGGTDFGRDGNVEVFDAEVTAAGTITGFTMLTTANQCGPVAVLRLREVTVTAGGVGSFTGTTTTTGTMTGFAPVTGTPVLTRRIVGPTGLVSTVSTNTTSARLKIGTNPAVTTGVVHTTPVVVDPDSGRAIHDTTGLGLTPGQRYYFRVEMTGAETAEDTGDVGELPVAATGPHSFGFSFGSCTDYALMPGAQTDSLALQAIAALDDDLFIHLGDLWYADGTGSDVENFRTRMGAAVDSPATTAILSSRAATYTPSDHDSGMVNDTNSIDEAVALASFNQVHREVWPQPHPTTGVYYTFTHGRVRFIQLDTRSFRSRQGSADNAGKTMLGATQKQWLKDQVDAAGELLIVLVQDVPWIGAATASSDTWTGYTTERTELAAHLAASGKNIIILAGDMHSAAYGDGTNSPGGIPVLHASPFLTNASRDAGPYTLGPFPAAGTAVSQQYGHVDIADNGTKLTFTFEARSSSGTVLLSAAQTYGPTGGGFTGTNTTTGAFDGSRDSRGSFAGTTTTTGTLAGETARSGTFTGTTTSTGVMGGTAPAEDGPGVGTFAGTTTATGTLVGARRSVGSFAGVTTVTGAFSGPVTFVLRELTVGEPFPPNYSVGGPDMTGNLFADDPDVHIVYPVGVRSGDFEFEPVVRIEGFEDITAVWEAPADSNTRKLRVPLYGLPPDQNHVLRLVVPGDNDLKLGPVVLSR